MRGLTYDTGALIAAERDSKRVWGLHRQALQRGIQPVVSAGALGEAWRGGPQPRLSRLLRACRVEPVSEDDARAAGAALAASGTSDVIDAVVTLGALAREDLTLTSDPEDLRRIAEGIGREIALQRV